MEEKRKATALIHLEYNLPMDTIEEREASETVFDMVLEHLENLGYTLVSAKTPREADLSISVPPSVSPASIRAEIVRDLPASWKPSSVHVSVLKEKPRD